MRALFGACAMSLNGDVVRNTTTALHECWRSHADGRVRPFQLCFALNSLTRQGPLLCKRDALEFEHVSPPLRTIALGRAAHHDTPNSSCALRAV